MIEFYVASMDTGNDGAGSDDNPGTMGLPFATIARAQEAVRDCQDRGKESITVYLRGGTHYLDRTLALTQSDSGTSEAPVCYSGYPGERTTVSGGRLLECAWEACGGGVYKTSVTGPGFTQLFVNGQRMVPARYPNYAPDDPLVHGRGYTRSVDAVDDVNGRPGFTYRPEEFTEKVWENPQKAVLHISHNWGFLQYRIDEVDRENHTIYLREGGWQINIVGPWGEFGLPDPADKDEWLFHDRRFYIENVREELDAPGEWFLDDDTLYFYPPADVDLGSAMAEVPVLETAVSFAGTQGDPVQHIGIRSVQFSHTLSTFLADYEAPSMGDWTIHRGGTVLMEGTRSCFVEGCFFNAVGGNGVFVNNSNHDARIADSTFANVGESAVCVVGTQKEAYGTRRPYPMDTVVENNHIHHIGSFGKQVAGVFVSSAFRTVVRHNLMHSLPRAGVCLNDCWGGGHVIEHNEIYDTVRETRDHGPFNSWGREGFWCENHSHKFGGLPYPHPVMITRMPDQTIIRNNYFHGIEGYVTGDYRQAIDLDDGSTNFHVYNNLCVDIAISIREGENRIVENNIVINPVVPFGMHVLYDGNHDTVRHNIIVTRGDIYHMNDAPPTQPWLAIDGNLFFNSQEPWGYTPYVTVSPRGEEKRKLSLKQWQELGYDTHSQYADPLFVDPDNGNYQVRDGSPALDVGFTNFAMDFGLTGEFPTLWTEETD